MISNEYFKHYMSVISKQEEKIQHELLELLSDTSDKADKKILLSLIETTKNHQEKIQTIEKMIK